MQIFLFVYFLCDVGGSAMITAYVLLKVKRGGEETVDQVKKLKGVIDFSLIYGEYDAVVKIQKENLEELQNMLVKDLRAIDGIGSTTTLICT